MTTDTSTSCARLSQGTNSGTPVSNTQSPLPRHDVGLELVRCIGRSVMLISQRRLRWPTNHVGTRLVFDDGTSARVYRETIVQDYQPREPTVLVVKFRLRLVRGRGHAAFRVESILNTPLFVGFPGFVNKLWLAHDQNGYYRGFYQWDGSARAERYARSLWRILALVSEPDSIGYQVMPGLWRDEVLAAPGLLAEVMTGEPSAWWRLVAVR